MTDGDGSAKQARSRRRRYRNFPKHELEEALVLPQKIQDEMGGRPMKRLLLAEAVGSSPSSSNYRALLSSSRQYGLTKGTEKAVYIHLTELGDAVTRPGDKRLRALREAALAPDVFRAFFQAYAEKKLPSLDMLARILATEYEVPEKLAAECAEILTANGEFAHITRDISGSPHVMLEPSPPLTTKPDVAIQESDDHVAIEEHGLRTDTAADGSAKGGPPKAIFVGHGKKKGPLQQLQRILTSFQIPHKVVVDEANLGRPIPQKVKDTMRECGSAILIFTRDELFFDSEGREIWRPSENVVHELGAASYAYEDRIVIFKERGLHFPTNFQSIGYIEFEEAGLEAGTTELLKELIGFGLVKITTS